MKINMKIDGKDTKVEIPFWDTFKMFITSYLALMGIFFVIGVFIGIFF